MKKILFSAVAWFSFIAISCSAKTLCINNCDYEFKTKLDTPATIPPGYYPFKLGHFVITAINDGTMLFPVDHVLTGAKPGEIQKYLSLNHRAAPVETAMNCFLINTGSQLILIDAGGGDAFRAGGLGRLLDNLAAAGYRPELINAVLLTHFHPDHSGGLIVNSHIAFPNANIYMHQADYDLLFGAAGEKIRASLTNEINLFTPYKNAGKIKTFDKRKELIPGITAIPTPGHTPGHSCYLVSSDQKNALIWGDIVHVAEVQFPDPAVAVVLDADQAAAVAQRQKIFAEVEKNGYLIGGAHIPFPGLGYVGFDEGLYRWIPVTYSTDNKNLIFK